MKRLSYNFEKKAMDNATNCARLSNKNRQERGQKHPRITVFPNTNGYDLTGIRSCPVILICNAFHFRAKEIIGYKRETI